MKIACPKSFESATEHSKAAEDFKENSPSETALKIQKKTNLEEKEWTCVKNRK